MGIALHGVYYIRLYNVFSQYPNLGHCGRSADLVYKGGLFLNEETATMQEVETISEETSLPETETSTVYEIHFWDEHPMMTTSFADYSVAEGLLLLIFVILLLDFFLKLFRR